LIFNPRLFNLQHQQSYANQGIHRAAETAIIAFMAENSTVCAIQTGVLPETDWAGVALFSQPGIG
jgi:hypothetical protein